MFKKLVNNFIFWLYDKLEEERQRRKALLDQLVNAVKAEKLRKQDELQKKNAQDHLARVEKKQSSCLHLKGGRGTKSPRTDYAVWQHTFPDGHVEIHCMICDKIWSKENNNLEEGFRFAEQSTNTASSSERVSDTIDRSAPQPWPASKQDPDSPEERYMPFMTTGWMEYLKVLWKRAKTGSDS